MDEGKLPKNEHNLWQLLYWANNKYKYYTKCRIKIRNSDKLVPKPEHEKLNGLELYLKVEFRLDDDDSRYPNEFALSDIRIENGKILPSQLLSLADTAWIASGDVQIIEPLDVIPLFEKHIHE